MDTFETPTLRTARRVGQPFVDGTRVIKKEGGPTRQVRDALANDMFPLIVSEGTSPEKMTRSQHSNYLGRGFRSIAKIGGTLYLYGFAMSANDEHWTRLIEGNRALKKLFVGIYGGLDKPENQPLVNRALAIQESRGTGRTKLPVGFFDAASAKVWG